MAEVQFRAGYVPSDQSREMFAQACRSIGEPIFGKPSHDISIARLLAQMLRVTEQFEMTVQPQLLLLQKTMLMAEGMGTRLNPHVNIWELARPLIEEWMTSHFGPRATIGRAVEDLAQGLRRLPRLIDSLHVVAERERRRAEAEFEQPCPRRCACGPASVSPKSSPSSPSSPPSSRGGIDLRTGGAPLKAEFTPPRWRDLLMFIWTASVSLAHDHERTGGARSGRLRRATGVARSQR